MRQVKSPELAETFILATEGVGTGELPTGNNWLALDPPKSHHLIDLIHAGQSALKNLPKSALAALDKFDPEHNAIVVGTFLHEHEYVADRKSLMYRKSSWLALDDKTVIDKLWDEIGITREQAVVVPVERTSIEATMISLDQGNGVVISGDSREGVGGGASGVRWVRTKTDLENAVTYFQKVCDLVRVMPFMEGIPCSIHGVVFDDYVVALRPVEMIVLRKTATNEFFYAGTATFWDPSDSERQYMRDLAKRVGTSLRKKVNYRGIFTIDGVLTKFGFRPTELNTRSGAGMKSLLSGISDLPLELIAQVATSGFKADYRPAVLEDFVIKLADKHRGGGTWAVVAANLPNVENRLVSQTTDGWKWDSEGSSAVTIGPSAMGGFVRLTPSPEAISPGQSFASSACSFWGFIDHNFGNDIGLLEAAKSEK